ncbi:MULTISPECIES: hypothetical protein [Bacillaceae]|uniref:hypothetical protein n=1 Tax=Bacillales TaxID=1385 RepID=UPI001883E0E5|nr:MULTISPECIES: hypothetical protein [Bacillaceae]MBF0705421.1 hypothetical protein [Pseudalkalibacillus hwajinpoensis]MDO6657789.1 hypothetical protein [Anaerobacillus sp. 1_MG-2023]WLR61490.1 hypothetical protein LC071_09470 [Pseudalkalibacillus hwajinpoensis]
MKELHSLTVRERILESTSLLHKQKQLQDAIDDIHHIDEQFLNLVRTIIISEDQQGEIVKAMVEETERYTMTNRTLLTALENQSEQAVKSLDRQADDLKVQSLTITYEDTPSA